MKKFCPYCGSIVPAGRPCPCRPVRKRKPTAGDKTRWQREPWRTEYSSAEYRSARQIAIARTKGRCTDCGVVCARKKDGKWYTSELGGEVDHIIPLCDGGSNEPSNLALRCKSCHGKRDAKRRRDSRTRLR